MTHWKPSPSRFSSASILPYAGRFLFRYDGNWGQKPVTAVRFYLISVNTDITLTE